MNKIWNARSVKLALIFSVSVALTGCAAPSHSEAFTTLCEKVAQANETLVANVDLLAPEGVGADRIAVQSSPVDGQMNAISGTASYFTIMSIEGLFFDTEALAGEFTDKEKEVFPDAASLEIQSVEAQAALHQYLQATESTALNAQADWLQKSQTLNMALSNSGIACSLK